MKNDAYWEKRAAERMYEFQKAADDSADEIAKAYMSSSDYIKEEIEKIFRNYQLKNGLTEDEAKKLLKNLPDDLTLENLKEIVKNVTDEDQRKELLGVIDSPAYAHRIGRFEQLQKNIDNRMAELSDFEHDVTRNHYTNICEEAYYKSIFDLQKGTGIGFSFSKLPQEQIKEILMNSWSGKHYSERIWDREKDISHTIKEELLTQFMTGRGYNKTAKAIEERMESGAIEARRLVRTESAYIETMAEVEGYKESGIEKLRFCATLDMKTSELCAENDGKVIEVSEAVPGSNVPPLHPWCRSCVVAFFDDEDLSKLKRKAIDPTTGEYVEVPADMTYKEWLKMQEETYGAENIKTEKKIAKAPTKRDSQQFSNYSNVLKELSPKTLDEFQKIKYNDKEEWEKLKYNYRTANRYEIMGKASAAEVLELDNVAWYTKNLGFDFEKIKEFTDLNSQKRRQLRDGIKSGGNVAAMRFDGETYFSHSKVGFPGTREYDLYTGKYPIVGLSEEKIFAVKDLGDTIPRENDTEAKFFEFVAAKKDEEDEFEITILSEKHICESCLGVMEQFQKKFPKAKVNIISGKRGYNGSEDGLKTYEHRKKVDSK